MKICKKCGIEKDISQFPQHKRCLQGVEGTCKECRNNIRKDWLIKNPNHLKEWKNNNQNRVKEHKKKYIESHPWATTYNTIHSRCCQKNGTRYKDYGGRGIKTYLHIKDLKYLWMRDKAFLMKQPSIDRINNDGNYTLENCRYMELSENIRKRGKEQYA